MNTDKTIELNNLKQFFDNPQDGKIYRVTAYVEKVFRREDGLNLFTIFDGGDYFKLARFIPKTVAFPEVLRGSVATFTFKAKYYEGNLEGTPLEANLVEGKQRSTFMKQMRERIASKFRPDSEELIVDSEAFRKLHSRMIHTASLIRQAVYEKRPILMTHHADCDGFSAGFLLENAIKLLLEQAHPHERFRDRLLTRIPSRSPFYDIIDATRDIGFFMTSEHRHGEKPPLVLIVDNGSTAQDVLSIQKVKLFGADVAVIDHHDPGALDDEKQSVICKEVLEHVNPHLEDLSNGYSASLLAYAIAPFIFKHSPSASAAAVGAVADKSDVPELDTVIGSSGETRDFFEELALYIDYEIHLTKSNTSYSVLHEFILGSSARKRELINLYKDMFQKQEQEVFNSVKAYARKERIGSFDLCLLDGEKTSFRGDYYSIGKLAGMTHDAVHDSDASNAMTIVYSDSILVFRVKQSDDFFDVNKLITHLQSKFPAARISGGGHAVAGSIKFLPIAFDEVFAEIENYVANL
ncbi:MAG: DHH family phosphoesterase [Candidatus Woesearchaeota archaeon]